MNDERVRKGEGERLSIRPLLPLAGDRRLAREAQELASEHFPDEWIRRSNQGLTLRATTYFPLEGLAFFVVGLVVLLGTGAGVVTSILGSVVFGCLVPVIWYVNGFGYYSGTFGILALGNLNGGERAANILHELGHRMQEAVPGFVEYEREFLERKLGRKPKRWGPVEFAGAALRFLAFLPASILTLGRVDLWSRRRTEKARGVYHPYVMEERPDGRSFEVFTMGIQGLHFGAKNPKTGEFDPDLTPHPDHEELIERMLQELR